jgi:hypothetical protein
VAHLYVCSRLLAGCSSPCYVCVCVGGVWLSRHSRPIQLVLHPATYLLWWRCMNSKQKLWWRWRRCMRDDVDSS